MLASRDTPARTVEQRSCTEVKWLSVNPERAEKGERTVTGGKCGSGRAMALSGLGAMVWCVRGRVLSGMLARCCVA